MPAPNSDFYELAETLPPEELAVVKQVRAFMETKVAPIITKYWVEDAFPFELLPAVKDLNIGGLGMKGYGCRGGSALLSGLVMMEMARFDPSFATFFGVHDGLAQKKTGGGRPVVAFIGDGALQYSIQCLYSAAQRKLKVIFIVPWNEEYAVLKEFAALENTPNVPGLDLPGLDIVSAARGFGSAGVLTRTKEEIKEAFGAALSADGPTVIVIPIAHEDRPLVPPVSD